MSNNTSSASASSSTNTASSFLPTMQGISKDSILPTMIAILVVAATALSITSFSMISSYAGSNENSYQKVKDKMASILGISFGAAFCLCIASLMFYYSSPKYAVVFQTVILMISFALSFAALATAALRNA